MVSFTIVVALFLPAAAIAKEYYTAAVFEHQTRGIGDSTITVKESIALNLMFYTKAVQIAAENNSDIIVFNEYGLIAEASSRDKLREYAEEIPDPKMQQFNPCLEKRGNSFILSTLSCLAREFNIYVVANMLDIHKCESVCRDKVKDGCSSKCPDDGVYIYNTDVAFDREGYLVARYHKLHPYFELVDTPLPEFITFDTDFGRFGMIVCFDLVFEESVKLVQDYKVDTLLFPTYWFDDIVPLRGIEFQQAWALANSVNFLAANAQFAKTGSLGSGIYSKHSGALVYTYDNDGDSKLLLANVKVNQSKDFPKIGSITVIREDAVFPKVDETGENFPQQCYEDYVGPAKDINEFRCFKSRTENFTISKLLGPVGKVQACHNGFCCSLNYSTNGLKDDYYLAVFNSTNNVRDFYFWWEETCLLLRCDSFNNKECVMEPSTSKTIFKTVEMRAKFESGKVYPTATENHFRLAPKEEWSVERNSASETILKFKSDSNVPLLNVGLMGRIYTRDPPFIPWH